MRTPEQAPDSNAFLNPPPERTDLRETQEQREKREQRPKYDGALLSLEKERQDPNRINEDAAFIDAEAGVVGVFDGLGGEGSGNVASDIGRRTLEQATQENKFDGLDVDSTKRQLERVLLDVQKSILAYTEGHSEARSAKTTAVISSIVEQPDGKRIAVIAHLGDSRASVFRQDGSHKSITLDHKLFSAGDDQNKARDLQESADIFPPDQEPPSEIVFAVRNNRVTQWIGRDKNDDFKIAFDQVELGPQDYLELCSDGVSENLSRLDRAKMYSRNPSAEDATRMIAHAAQVQSRDRESWRAKPDDMTVAVLRMPEKTYETINEVTIDKKNAPLVARDGSLDWGWEFKGSIKRKDPETGKMRDMARLQKKAPGGKYEKEISIHELRTTIALSKVKTFNDLYNVLRSAKELEGSIVEVPQKTTRAERILGKITGKEVPKTKKVTSKYGADTLIRLIDLVREGRRTRDGKKIDTGSITRSAGLRNKVIELMSAPLYK